MQRKEVKEAHENAVLNSFVKHCENNNRVVIIIDKPEPPDAIVTIDGYKTWIEVTDAFISKELAESTTTYAADDKTHKPVPKEKRFLIEPDRQFSNILETIIVKKYEKASIGKVYKQYGEGILLVGIINPFSDAKELIVSEKEKIMTAIKSKEQRFSDIYLYDVYDRVFWQLL